MENTPNSIPLNNYTSNFMYIFYPFYFAYVAHIVQFHFVFLCLSAVYHLKALRSLSYTW